MNLHVNAIVKKDTEKNYSIGTQTLETVSKIVSEKIDFDKIEKELFE